MENKQPEPLELKGFQTVTVTKMGHIVEVQHMKKKNTIQTIKKLDKFNYVDLTTGEIKQFNKIENRQQSYNSLRQTFKKLRYLINNNFKGKPNELYITLTYRPADYIADKVSLDYKNFLKRLKYKFKGISTIDAIRVQEPHATGKWHFHVLLRFNDLDKIFIPSKQLADIWGKGYVNIKSLKNVDNIGAYLSAYLTDLEFTEDKVPVALKEGLKVVYKDIEGESKPIIKGGRLHMYPPGLNIFTKTKGIVYPEREEMLFQDVKKVVGSQQPHYSKKYVIDNDNFNNEITFVQYNLKREKNEDRK